MKDVASGGLLPNVSFSTADLACKEATIGGERHQGPKPGVTRGEPKFQKEPGILGIPDRNPISDGEGELAECGKEQKTLTPRRSALVRCRERPDRCRNVSQGERDLPHGDGPRFQSDEPEVFAMSPNGFYNASFRSPKRTCMGPGEKVIGGDKCKVVAWIAWST